MRPAWTGQIRHQFVFTGLNINQFCAHWIVSKSVWADWKTQNRSKGYPVLVDPAGRKPVYAHWVDWKSVRLGTSLSVGWVVRKPVRVDWVHCKPDWLETNLYCLSRLRIPYVFFRMAGVYIQVILDLKTSIKPHSWILTIAPAKHTLNSLEQFYSLNSHDEHNFRIY